MPAGGLDLIELSGQGACGVSDKEELQIVVDVRLLPARGLAGDIMAVDDEGTVLVRMPGMEPQAHNAGFLDRLTPCRLPEEIRWLIVTAGLEPALQGLVINEQRLREIWRNDQCTVRHMDGVGLTAFERVALINLPAQQRKVFMRARNACAIISDNSCDTLEKTGFRHEKGHPVGSG